MCRLETYTDFMTKLEDHKPSEEQAKLAKKMHRKGFNPIYMQTRHKIHTGSYDVYSVDVKYMKRHHENIPRFVWKNKPDKLQAKLDDPKSRKKINVPDNYGRTACHFAAAYGEVDRLVQLLNCKEQCNVNATDDEGKTPLRKAVEAWKRADKSVYNQILDCIRLLLQHKANPNINARDRRNPLEYALQELGDTALPLIKVLYDEGKMFKERRELGRLTHLHIVCMADKDVEVLKTAEFLLQNGAFINATEGTGRTALMIAAMRGRPDLVKLLIQYGAQVDHIDMKTNSTKSYAKSGTDAKQLITDALRGKRPEVRRGLTENTPVIKHIKMQLGKLKY